MITPVWFAAQECLQSVYATIGRLQALSDDTIRNELPTYLNYSAIPRKTFEITLCLTYGL
jgi:hypothetical protein